MRKMTSIFISLIALAVMIGCQQNAVQTEEPQAVKSVALTQAELSAMANAVPNEGPREGENYKVYFLALHQNQAPAVNFKVDMWVKGKSDPITVRTNDQGLAVFENLPFPDAKHKLEGVIHYYKNGEDQPREITYPFLKSDAYRLKDVQYIPNTVTPDPSVS